MLICSSASLESFYPVALSSPPSPLPVIDSPMTVFAIIICFLGAGSSELISLIVNIDLRLSMDLPQWQWRRHLREKQKKRD